MRLRSFLGLAAVLAIAIGSVIGALLVRSHEDSAFERRQREEALRASHQAEATAALSVGQLASAAAFYQATDELTQHKFDLMADSLLNASAWDFGARLTAPSTTRSGSPPPTPPWRTPTATTWGPIPCAPPR
jgi:hypothetical protein